MRKYGRSAGEEKNQRERERESVSEREGVGARTERTKGRKDERTKEGRTI